MVKLNILNMENFLDTVNACAGKVYMLCQNGKKQNINGEEKIQDSLWRQYFRNKNCLSIILEIPNPTDYMNIVSYYAGDCWFVCKYFIIKGWMFYLPALFEISLLFNQFTISLLFCVILFIDFHGLLSWEYVIYFILRY